MKKTKAQLEAEIARLKLENQTAWSNVEYKAEFREFMRPSPKSQDLCSHCGEPKSMSCM